MSTIKAYHGTLELDKIIKDGRIYSPQYMWGENGWRKGYDIYDRITKDTAAKVREALNGDCLDWANEFDQELVTSDEGLTDLAAERPYEYPFDGRDNGEYKELKRNLFVFLSSDFDCARNYVFPRGSHQTFPGVLELDLPVEMVRPGQYPLEKMGYLLVPKKVSLELLSGIYVNRDNFRIATELLDASGFANIRVMELK